MHNILIPLRQLMYIYQWTLKLRAKKQYILSQPLVLQHTHVQLLCPQNI